jgi:hypothetical protein
LTSPDHLAFFRLDGTVVVFPRRHISWVDATLLLEVFLTAIHSFAIQFLLGEEGVRAADLGTCESAFFRLFRLLPLLPPRHQERIRQNYRERLHHLASVTIASSLTTQLFIYGRWTLAGSTKLNWLPAFYRPDRLRTPHGEVQILLLGSLGSQALSTPLRTRHLLVLKAKDASQIGPEHLST